MIVLYIIGIILLLWLVLTLIAQMPRSSATVEIGNTGAKSRSALLVYNPDLFYDLDKKVCIAMAEGLESRDWSSRICTVSEAAKSELFAYDLYVFCANTYNWAPDRPVSDFIRNFEMIRGKPVVAITLGSGSTVRSQQLLEEMIREKGGIIMASETYWLMRPNDESRSGISNVQVAIEKSRMLGEKAAAMFDD